MRVWKIVNPTHHGYGAHRREMWNVDVQFERQGQLSSETKHIFDVKRPTPTTKSIKLGGLSGSQHPSKTEGGPPSDECYLLMMVAFPKRTLDLRGASQRLAWGCLSPAQSHSCLSVFFIISHYWCLQSPHSFYSQLVSVASCVCGFYCCKLIQLLTMARTTTSCVLKKELFSQTLLSYWVPRRVK